MRVIPPVSITDSMLTSSTVPEEVAATYNAGTPYAAGERAGAAIVYGSSQTVWESLQNGNTGNTQVDGAWWTNRGIVYAPYNSGSSCDTGGRVQDNTNHLLYESLVDANTGNALSDDTKWQLVGPTNRWAMFDTSRSTATESPTSFTVVFAPGRRTDSFAITGAIAASYTLTVTSVIYGGTIYSVTGDLYSRDSITTSWYEFFFGGLQYQKSTAVFDIPPYTDAIYTLTITGSNVSLGACIVGMSVYLGATQHTAESDVVNYSSITRNENGLAVLTPRRNVPKTKQVIFCEKSAVNRIRVLRDELNATPAIWFGINDESSGYFDALTILGIYKEFTINMAYPENALVSLTLEEI